MVPSATPVLHDRPAPPDHASVWRIVLEVIRGAPPSGKRGVLIIVVTWFVVSGIQIWDVRDRSGPRVIAELMGSYLGMGGMLLVCLTKAIQQMSEGVACARVSWWRVDSRQFNQALIVLPACGFIAGAMLAASLAITLMRLVLGSSSLIYIIVAADAFFLAIAALTVTQTSRLLYRHARERGEALTRASAEATEAKLAALQSQLNPHFLFNALNTVASLVRTDPNAAERTVENLSEILRRTLQRSADLLRTLGDEIDYVRAYLAIEKERFGDRLDVEWAIAPGLESLLVPTMTLQPLVENAVKHGIAPKRSGGRVRIAATQEGARVRLAVEDDGEGFAPRYQEGTGLANLRKRLETMYGPDASLRVESSTSGSRVTVELPVQRG